jgi:hypothetical protein
MKISNIANACAFHEGLEIRSAGADSPRTGSGTYENPGQWLLGRVPKLWLIALQRCPPRIGIVQKPRVPFHGKI